jgi:hypothetical protein
MKKSEEWRRQETEVRRKQEAGTRGGRRQEAKDRSQQAGSRKRQEQKAEGRRQEPDLLTDS